MEELPAAAFYDLTRPTAVAIAPDGDRVAFTAVASAPDEDECVSSVFVVPADGQRNPHRLTRVSSAGTIEWSPDGSKLGVIMARETDTELRVGREEDDIETGGAGVDDADGETGESATAGTGSDGDSEGDDDDDDDDDGDVADDGDGVENDDEPNPQLWVYDLERGGDARQVTERDEGVRDFDWGPAGERVVIAARDPTDDETEYLEQRREGGPIETERLQHKFDGQGWLDTVTTYLFVVDVERRESHRLDETAGAGILEPEIGLQPAWHPQDDRIAFVTYRGPEPDDTYVQDVHVVDAETGDCEQVTAGEYTAMGPTWSPDGERLAFGARDPENWYAPTEVCVRAATGEYEPVTEDLDRTVGLFGTARWIDDETLLAGLADEGWTRFVRLGADGPHERAFDHQSRDESLRQFDVAGNTVAAVFSHPTDGLDVVALDVEDLSAGPDEADPRRRLSALNADLIERYAHPQVRRLTFESTDGTTVDGMVAYPPTFDPDAAEPDPHPTILWIHGGPMAYDQPQFRFGTSFLTTRGYIVFNVNYRGSTSYGRAFCEALKGAWNTVEVEDLLAGVDALVDSGWADPDRLFVGGFSQGGVNTAYVCTRTDRFAAGIAEHGVYDMRSSFGTDDSHKWFELDFGLPWENPDAYDTASSITDVDEIDTPLLLTAGGEDWRCPPTQSEQLYRSLRKRGVESKLVVYPDEHHNVGDPDRAIHRFETMDAWLARFDPERDAGQEAETAES